MRRAREGRYHRAVKWGSLLVRRSLGIMSIALGVGGCGLLLDVGEVELDPNIDCSSGACQCAKGFADCQSGSGRSCDTNLQNDDQNCGACGHGCEGGACLDGACQPVFGLYIRGGSEATSFVAEDGRIFVGSEGMVTEVSLDKSDRPHWMNVSWGGTGAAIRDEALIVAGFDDANGWSVLEGPRHLPFEPKQIFHSDELSTDYPYTTVGASKGHVFFFENKASIRDLAVIPRAGGPKTMISISCRGVAVAPDRAYWVDAKNLYMFDDAQNKVTLTSAEGLLPMAGMVGDRDVVYYTLFRSGDPGTIEVWELHPSDGSKQQIHALPSRRHDASMDMDDRYLYLVTELDGQAALVRISRALPFSAPKPIASLRRSMDEGVILTVRVTDRVIFWSNLSGDDGFFSWSAVHYVAKPLD